MTSDSIINDINFTVIYLIIAGVLSFYYLLTLFSKIKKLKMLAATRKLFGLTLFTALFLTLAFLLLTTQGYQKLTQEVLIATVTIVPVEEQRYTAIIEFTDGGIRKFDLQGDEIILDANFIKWESWVSILGFKPAYRLDRIRGRYIKLEDEKNKPSSIFEIDENNQYDIADWRYKYEYLTYLMDVKHGSATYVSAKSHETFHLVATNSGLLLRKIE